MVHRSSEYKSRKLAQTQKNFINWVILLICVTFTAIFLFGDHGLLQLYKLKVEKRKIQSNISELRKEREYLISEKNKLENDLKYIEKLAREKYRMAKPGERVYKVISEWLLILFFVF